MLRVLRIAHDLGIEAYGSPTTDLARWSSDPVAGCQATVHELGALAVYFVTGGAPPVERPGADAGHRRRRPRDPSRTAVDATQIVRTKSGLDPLACA